MTCPAGGEEERQDRKTVLCACGSSGAAVCGAGGVMAVGRSLAALADLAASAAAGRLRPRGMHQLGHSYASLLIPAGAHPEYIPAQLSHASIQITMAVYGHLLPGSFAKLVNALDTPTRRNPRATTPADPEPLSR